MSNHLSPFRSALSACWALLLGFAILMLGDGLQATLLAVRADQEGFSTTITGLIMSTFYLGFLFGSIYVPRIMVHVGHIRVFAALAALASATILVHAVFVAIPVWFTLRLISGFCFAGLYVVAESWLNDRATNETRGKILSLYMVVTYVGVGIGQLFLNLGNPKEYPLFILTSVLISIAVVPLLLSAGQPPKHEEAVNIRLKTLYKISPLGIIGMFMVGMVTATFFALGPVYGQRLGMSVKEISYFMTAAVTGTVILQWPIGALSDKFDRRKVLTIITLLTSILAIYCSFMADQPLHIFLIITAIYTGLSLPLYSVCIAYTNDHLQPNQMIAASGTLVLVGGIGAVIGPIMIASIMDNLGNHWFFLGMAGAHFLTGIFALYRMVARPLSRFAQKGVLTPTTIRPSSSVIETIQHHAAQTDNNS